MLHVSHRSLNPHDRFDPVYAIFMTDPVHRWIPRSGKGDCWGGLGIIIAART